MANTWTAIATGVTFSTTTKSLLQLFNGGTRVLRVYRVWCINANITGVAGVLPLVNLGIITTAASGGSPTTITPLAHDTTNTSLDTVTCNSGNTTVTSPTILKRHRRDTDEFVISVLKPTNFFGLPNFAIYHDSGYGDTNIEPIVLPQNRGLVLYTPGIASAAGNCDVIFEFTDSAS